jgi:hypothetical protein
MFSINPDVDSGAFRRPDCGSERRGIQCGEHGSDILVDDSEQGASRRFWDPTLSLPVLNGVKVEPKRLRESGLRHAKSISNRGAEI